MTTLAQPASPPARRHARTGAPLLPPVLSYAALCVLAVVVPPAIAGEAPWSSDSALLDFFAHHGGAAHAQAFLTFGGAIPFAVLTAVATTRLRTLGFDVPGRIIGQVGGAVAAALLALSGLTVLAITRPQVAHSRAAVRALYALAFAAGGPGFVGFTGLLLAGVSIPCLVGALIPRWLAWTGLGLAVVCELGTFAVAFDALDPVLPVGRFGSLLWLLALAVTLPADRRDGRARKGVVRSADLG